MCGITGIVDLTERREIDRSLLMKMNDTQIHRGPDGSGYHWEPGVGLGHRRLSIIDIEGGSQPMFNEDKTVAVTYNGEIYDFAALREELVVAGHRFVTKCDTEVLVHGWEEWGAGIVEKINGMFAFAIWDRNRRTLFLARDRLGKKPLYYYRSPNGFLIFASELKAIMQFPGIERTLDPTAIKEYMTFGYVPDPKTIFRNIYKLPPGHLMQVVHGAGQVEPRRYWDVRFATRDERDGEEIGNELLSRLADATRRRMVADVPLGAFLSGGVDSSAVVTAMASLSQEPVNTCAISFGNPAFNESRYAQIIADRLNTKHHVEQVDTDDFELIDRITAIYDEPFADSSAIPTFRVCELARKHVKVALSGDGGDEVFAGYRRYRWHMHEERVRNVMPRWLRRGVFGTAGKIYPKMDWAPRIFRAKSTLQAIARDSIDAYLHSVSILPDDLHSLLFSKQFESDLQGYSAREVFMAHLAQCDAEDELSRIQYLDFKTYLPGDILTKVDRASMANSLEVRVPLLDHEFVSWAGGLPASVKLRKGEGKFVFKKALESWLPREILYRDKMGFAVPLASWFRGPLRQTISDRLLGTAMRDSGVFDIDSIAKILKQHLSGTRDHSPAIWALLVFEGFYRSTVGS